MATRWQTLTVVSTRRTELLDITEAVGRACREGDAGDGLVVVYCPHTTAGILIQEAEPGLLHDLEGWLSRAVPSDASYRHDRIDDNAAKPPTGGRRRGERHGASARRQARAGNLAADPVRRIGRAAPARGAGRGDRVDPDKSTHAAFTHLSGVWRS